MLIVQPLLARRARMPKAAHDFQRHGRQNDDCDDAEHRLLLQPPGVEERIEQRAERDADDGGANERDVAAAERRHLTRMERIPRQKSGRSSGLRLLTWWRSTTMGASSKIAPALTRSSL